MFYSPQKYIVCFALLLAYCDTTNTQITHETDSSESQIGVSSEMKIEFLSVTDVLVLSSTMSDTYSRTIDIEQLSSSHTESSSNNTNTESSNTVSSSEKLSSVSIEREPLPETTYPNIVKKGHFIDDRDDSEYTCVAIGDQVWMAEDLHYEEPTDAVCKMITYGHTNYNMCRYSASSALSAGICPDGWDIPAQHDWSMLLQTVDNLTESIEEAGKYLKADFGWTTKRLNMRDDVSHGIDAFGLSLLPFTVDRNEGIWWSNTDIGTQHTPLISGIVSRGHLTDFPYDKLDEIALFYSNGASIRCIQHTWATENICTEFKEGREPKSIAIVVDTSGFIGNSGTVKPSGYHEFKWIRIGDQIWMAQNLFSPVDGSLCYNNDDFECREYGTLYPWEVAMKGELSSTLNPSTVQGVCPEGWHIPSYREWFQLVNYIKNDLYGISFDFGYYLNTETSGLMNETGWYEYTKLSNYYGFSALPGGYYDEGSYTSFENGVMWLTSETRSTSGVYSLSFSKVYKKTGTGNLRSASISMEGAAYLRCVLDK
ncbi:MAG: hypothetical protein OCD01_14240 [Fibrobacterales bacterium]